MCRRQKVHAVDGNNQDSEDSDVDYDQYFVEAVENSSNHDRDWKIVVEINGKKQLTHVGCKFIPYILTRDVSENLTKN